MDSRFRGNDNPKFSAFPSLRTASFFSLLHTVMKPQKIKREGEALVITWPDGHVSNFTLEELRRACPCAGCKGEVLFGKVYMPASLPIFVPGMYELASLTPVGQYAVQAAWKDGHNTGIYSWDLLYDYGARQDAMWQQYLARLRQAGASREKA